MTCISRSLHARRSFPRGAALICVATLLFGCAPAERASNTPAGIGSAQSVIPQDSEGQESGGPTTSTDDSSTAESELQIPVYWLGEEAHRTALFQELVTIPVAESTGDPIADAVRAMTAAQPLNRDRTSVWQPSAAVSASLAPGNIITVDLSSEAFAPGIGATDAADAVQQLVHTASNVAKYAGLLKAEETSSVVILVDGKAGYRAFGTIDLTGPISPDNAKLASVWLTEPHDRMRQTGEAVRIAGSASAGTPLFWKAERKGPASGQKPAASEAVMSGSVTVSAEPGGRSGFDFSVDLPPGAYEITVFRKRAGTPQGGYVPSDSRTVRVGEQPSP